MLILVCLETEGGSLTTFCHSFGAAILRGKRAFRSAFQMRPLSLAAVHSVLIDRECRLSWRVCGLPKVALGLMDGRKSVRRQIACEELKQSRILQLLALPFPNVHRLPGSQMNCRLHGNREEFHCSPFVDLQNMCIQVFDEGEGEEKSIPFALDWQCKHARWQSIV